MSSKDREPMAEILRRAQESGVSYREMERRAFDAGWPLSHAKFQEYTRARVVKAPSVEHMQSIAAATGVDFEEVRDAAFQQFYGYKPVGLSESPGHRIGAMIPPDMPEAEEAELRRLLRSWLEAKRGS